MRTTRFTMNLAALSAVAVNTARSMIYFHIRHMANSRY
jgi:hypothetical protein